MSEAPGGQAMFRGARGVDYQADHRDHRVVSYAVAPGRHCGMKDEDVQLCAGVAIDYVKELTYYERKAIHNLKYFTWVERQGRDVAELGPNGLTRGTSRPTGSTNGSWTSTAGWDRQTTVENQLDMAGWLGYEGRATALVVVHARHLRDSTRSRNKVRGSPEPPKGGPGIPGYGPKIGNSRLQSEDSWSASR